MKSRSTGFATAMSVISRLLIVTSRLLHIGSSLVRNLALMAGRSAKRRRH